MREFGMQLASCGEDGSSRRCTVSKSRLSPPRALAAWAEPFVDAPALATTAIVTARTAGTAPLRMRSMWRGPFEDGVDAEERRRARLPDHYRAVTGAGSDVVTCGKCRGKT